MVGHLSGEIEENEFDKVISENHLEPYVIFHGTLYGKELDDVFENADFAIGSLGRHRSGITYIKTLKNREYAARGFSFIYSEIDTDFDNQPYVIKVAADESAVDIQRIIDFCQSNKITASEIRCSVSGLSWIFQMQKVLDSINSNY